MPSFRRKEDTSPGPLAVKYFFSWNLEKLCSVLNGYTELQFKVRHHLYIHISTTVYFCSLRFSHKAVKNLVFDNVLHLSNFLPYYCTKGAPGKLQVLSWWCHIANSILPPVFLRVGELLERKMISGSNAFTGLQFAHWEMNL